MTSYGCHVVRAEGIRGSESGMLVASDKLSSCRRVPPSRSARVEPAPEFERFVAAGAGAAGASSAWRRHALNVCSAADARCGTEVRRQSGAHFVNDALRDVAMRLLDHLPGGRTASPPASNLSSCSALHREPPADPLVYGRIAKQVKMAHIMTDPSPGLRE